MAEEPFFQTRPIKKEKEKKKEKGRKIKMTGTKQKQFNLGHWRR